MTTSGGPGEAAASRSMGGIGGWYGPLGGGTNGPLSMAVATAHHAGLDPRPSGSARPHVGSQRSHDDAQVPASRGGRRGAAPGGGTGHGPSHGLDDGLACL